jgi:Reverse transcriptase (RNA-dependent DNA polymerase)
VPQGSNLGPLLFLLFINDLTFNISCKKLLFADDLKIYCTIDIQEDCYSVQTNIDVIQNWCVENQLFLNINKCKTMTYTRKKDQIIFPYTIDDIEVQRCSAIIDLGVKFKSNMSFDEHIEDKARDATKMLIPT